MACNLHVTTDIQTG